MTNDTAALDIDAARRLDRRIRLMAQTISDSLAKLYELVQEAKDGQIHLALGYPSWTAYVADACKVEVRLDRDRRRELAGWLADEGMSQRAIAATLGVSKNTVTADVSQIGTPESESLSDFFDDADEAADIIAMADVDGETFDAVLAEARAGGDLSREAVARRCRDRRQDRTVTGMDGKTYAQPKQNRRPKSQQTRRKPPATFTRLMNHLTELNRLAAECIDMADEVSFKTNATRCGLVYDTQQQCDSALALTDGFRTLSHQLVDALTNAATGAKTP